MTIKKITALLMLSVLPLGVLTAQEEKDYLPKAGDWAIGIDMQPVYSFFGNLANGDAGNGLGQFGGEDAFGAIPSVSIMGKYMLDNTTAIRLNLGIEKAVDHHYDYRLDDVKNSDQPSGAKVQDYYKHNDAIYSLAAGIEFRKGENRIQGYVGADLVFEYEKDRYNISYGNILTNVNQDPTRDAATYNALGLGVLGVYNVGYWKSSYLTESYRKSTILGLAGKVGVEYFVVPKLAFGGEVSLMAAERFEAGSYTIQEGYNPISDQVETYTELVSPANREFYLGTLDMGGKLFMIFYF